MQLRLAVACVSTAATVAAAVGAFALSPGTPPVDLGTDFGPGDGLHRYVVTLDLTDASSTAATGAQAAATHVPDADGRRPSLDVAALGRAQDALGGGGTLRVIDGVPHYVTDAGTMPVAASDAGPAVPAPAGDEPPVAATDPADAVQALADQPGVVSAQLLADGRALVATDLDQSELDALAGVRDVELSQQVPVAATEVNPNDPYYAAYGWSLHNTGTNAYQQAGAVAGADISAPAGWAASQGDGMVVAVVDTGFYTGHPDLAGALWTNPAEACGSVDSDGDGKAGACHGWNFYTNSADVTNGTMGTHGTSVAGVIAARMDNGQGVAGVAPQATVMPLVVGGGSNVDIYLATQAIRWAVDHGADVINASFGGPVSGAALTALTAAVDYAANAGVLVVAAAGNDSGNRDTSVMYPASLTSDGVVTIGSTDAADRPAASSAYGATSVDLFAPGEKVVTTWDDGGYRLVSGTSIAAPHVTGAIADFLALDPDATLAEQRSWLAGATTPLSTLTGRCVTGGRLTVAGLTSAAGAVSYTFSSMVAPAGRVSPTVSLTAASGPGRYEVDLGLVMLVDGQVWAVSGEEVSIDGVSRLTDDDGIVRFDLGQLPDLGAHDVVASLDLGAGQFGLSAQVLKDGQALSRPFAAPLIVTATPDGSGSQNPAPDGPAPEESGAGGSGPGAPGSSGSGTPDAGSGGSAPGGSGSGGAGPGGSGPESTSPGGSGPGTGDSTTPGGSGPGSPDESSGGSGPGGAGTGGSGMDGSGSGGSGSGGSGSGDSGSGGSGSGDPGSGGQQPDPWPDGSGPIGSGPDGSGSTGPGSTGSGSDSRTYDRVGAFEVTSISRVHVSTSGSELVIIRGERMARVAGVRVGAASYGSSVVLILDGDAGTLMFLTPPMPAGAYDVTVYGAGQSSVLPEALIYSADASAGGPGPGPGPGGPDSGNPDGSGGGTWPGGSGDDGSGSEGPGAGGPGPGSSGPGTGDPGSGEPDSGEAGAGGPGSGEPGAGGPGSDGSGPGDSSGGSPSGPARRTGPNGEQLVASTRLTISPHLWSLSCTTSCSGVPV